MPKNIYKRILNKFRFLVVILCAIFFSLSPLQSIAVSSQAFTLQRRVCTDNYYNVGLYTQATDCYRQAWIDSCPYDQDACFKAKNNMYIAMDNYRSNVCNSYFNNKSYSLAGGCYDIGITQTCNLSPRFDDLCDKNKNNRNIVNNYLAGLGQYSNNYATKIQQLKDFKTNCNQNWYNGYIRAFVDCSNQGATDACSISGYEASVLCDNFRNNADIGNNRLNDCYYNSNYYSYNNCGTVSSGVKDAALIATGAVILCAVAGCFNSNNSSYDSYNSGGSSDSGYYYNNGYYDNYGSGGGSSSAGGGGGRSGY